MSEKSPDRALAKEKKSAPNDRRLVGQSYSFSGPIPPPQLLNKYDEETRRVIVTMAKKQSSHRQSIEAAVIASNIKNERTGMFIAAALTVSLMASGLYLVAIGKDVAGYLSIFGPGLFHAGNYIYNRSKENENAEEKDPS